MDDRDDALSMLVLITGPLALVVSTGWQVAWLVILVVVALVRRTGASWRGTAGGPVSPPDPAGA